MHFKDVITELFTLFCYEQHHLSKTMKA